MKKILMKERQQQQSLLKSGTNTSNSVHSSVSSPIFNTSSNGSLEEINNQMHNNHYNSGNINNYHHHPIINTPSSYTSPFYSQISTPSFSPLISDASSTGGPNMNGTTLPSFNANRDLHSYHILPSSSILQTTNPNGHVGNESPLPSISSACPLPTHDYVLSPSFTIPSSIMGNGNNNSVSPASEDPKNPRKVRGYDLDTQRSLVNSSSSMMINNNPTTSSTIPTNMQVNNNPYRTSPTITSSSSNQPVPSSSTSSSSNTKVEPKQDNDNEVATADSPIVEYLDDEGWIAQWFSEEKRRKWKLKVPQFKYCKKRKEHFDTSFPDTWYKAPYKYHMHLEVSNMMREENVVAYIDLNYEDGQKVTIQKEKKEGKKKKGKSGEDEGENGEQSNSNTTPTITNNESYFSYQSAQKSTVTIGPFMYNICSYKQDGKKFRMVVYLYCPNSSVPYHPFQQPQVLNIHSQGSNATLCCCLISPSFTIRAKKPIVKPGIKTKRKRGDDVSDDETTTIKPTVVQGTTTLPQQPLIKKQKEIQQDEIIQQGVEGSHAATLAIDELLESLYKNNGVLFDSSSVNGGASSSNANQQRENNSEEKIKNITETFQSMLENDRKKLLCKLVESCYPHEKEFLYRKYFEAGSMDISDNMGPFGNSQMTSSGQPYYTRNPNIQTMMQQYQMIQQQQQELYNYFATLNGNPMQSSGNIGSSSMPMQMPMNNNGMMNNSNNMPHPSSYARPNPTLNTNNPMVQNNIPPTGLTFAPNHQPSDVDQFFVELFD